MATAILTNAKKFREHTAGLTRAQELKWYRDVLGIEESRMLGLLDYTPADVRKRKAAGATFEELAEARPDRALWVSELFRELADRSGYDMARLSALLKPAKAQVVSSPKKPYKPAGKGSAARPGKKASQLLVAIRRGGPSVLGRLADYLRSGAGPTRKPKKSV
jgi:hypothetical protein